jgi:hypothetical protein
MLARVTASRTFRLQSLATPVTAFYAGTTYRRRTRYAVEQKYRLKSASSEQYTALLPQARLTAQTVRARLHRHRGSVRTRYLAYARARHRKHALYLRKAFFTPRLSRRHPLLGRKPKRVYRLLKKRKAIYSLIRKYRRQVRRHHMRVVRRAGFNASRLAWLTQQRLLRCRRGRLGRRGFVVRPF